MKKPHVRTLQFEYEGAPVAVEMHRAICVGYSGRDVEKTRSHIKELAEIGIPEPAQIPTVFPVAAATVTQETSIEVVGSKTSGEIELVLLYGDSLEESLLTAGSDHTDRALEAVDITKSKQVCAKPVAGSCWKVGEVLEHWDQMQMRSEMLLPEGWVAYQDHLASAVMPLRQITGFLANHGLLEKGGLYFLGTVPLLGGFQYGAGFRYALVDPVRDREIAGAYAVVDMTRDAEVAFPR